MEVRVCHPFPGSRDRVADVLFDPQRIVEKNHRLGHRNVNVTAFERHEDRVHLVVEREMQASVEVPRALTSFHKTWNRVEQEERWQRDAEGNWRCEFRIRADGIPARFRGEMRLEGDSRQATNHVLLQVDCQVPLLGRKVARFLAEDSKQKLEADYRAICEQLD